MTETKVGENSLMPGSNSNSADHDDKLPSACREKARRLYRGVALAPMVRASTIPLRTLALQYGADFTYTEELVDRSLSQTIRVENKDLGTIDYIKDPATLPKKTRKKLKADNNRPCLILRIDPKIEKGKLICQLGTGEPELALEAAKRVVGDVDAIDVNMGCPKKFSVSGGMGSALLKDPDRAARILRTLKNDLLGPLGKPLSCKIRLLETTQQTVNFVETMINAGADAVAIHARRVGHEPIVAADWKSVEEVLRILRPKYPDFNFLVNGDFYDRKERTEFIERTKVDGLLLGRPALYNTSTFLPLSPTTSSDEGVEPLVDKTVVVQEYLRHSVRYDSHYKNTKYVICEMMSHRRTPTGRVPYLPMKFQQGQTVKATCDCHDLSSLCEVWNVDHSKATARSPSNPDTTNECAIKNVAALVAGEHKYEDAYFLQREITTKNFVQESFATLDETRTADANPTARARPINKRSNNNESDRQNDASDHIVSHKISETKSKRKKIN